MSLGKSATLHTALLIASLFLFQQCKSQPARDSTVIHVPSPAPQIPKIVRPQWEDSILSCYVDSIVVIKRYREMHVFNNKKLVKKYKISLGPEPVGPKRFQGDMKTPEGLYYIKDRNPNSMAHKNLGISYPNEYDRQYARKFGKSTGGDIKIHGMVNGYEKVEDEYTDTDWTWGCIAVKNKDIDELFEYVIIGSPIYIMP